MEAFFFNEEILLHGNTKMIKVEWGENKFLCCDFHSLQASRPGSGYKKEYAEIWTSEQEI